MTETFATLWKGMNTMRVASNAPLINTPKGASPDLIRQANKKIGKGQNRKAVLGQLQTSTRKAPATVVAPPSLPNPSAPASQSGFGGSGYSGNNATRLGQSSNTGTSQAIAPAAPVLPPDPSLNKGLGAVVRSGYNVVAAGAARNAPRVLPALRLGAVAAGQGIKSRYQALEAGGAQRGGRVGARLADAPINAKAKRSAMFEARQVGRSNALKTINPKHKDGFLIRNRLAAHKVEGQTPQVKAAFAVSDAAADRTAAATHLAAHVARGARTGRGVVRAAGVGAALAIGSSVRPSPPPPPAVQAPITRMGSR